jgi:proton-translocating NADH-quinone oxidoreductase chain M
MLTLPVFFKLFLIIFVSLFLIPSTSIQSLYNFGLIGMFLIFLSSLIFWLEFNPYLITFQFLTELNLWSFLSIKYGIDGISLFLMLLTTIIFPLCFLTLKNSVKSNLKSFILLFFFLEFLLLNSFLVLDFFWFYVFFEISLIPMFLLIGFWGSKSRKNLAAFYLFLYTIFGSLFMLLSISYFYVVIGTTDYLILLHYKLPINIQLILWPAIFVGFAVKVPMFPFHIWLPEAHVEAPTTISVILAAIVLKLGSYGMLRFLFPLLPEASNYYAPFAIMLALIGSIYSALTALRQVDLKKIIAYSSIAHMNVGLLGLFSLTLEGFTGFYYVLLGHGLISSGLFFLVGVLYERYHSRLYYYYSGLVVRMPIFVVFFTFFTLANVGFPGTINFLSELLILCGISFSSFFNLCIVGLSLFFSTIYSFWLLNRISFGTLKIETINYYFDLSFLEQFILFILSLLIIIGGFFPQLILTNINIALLYLGQIVIL